jgi:hypothetical protein
MIHMALQFSSAQEFSRERLLRTLTDARAILEYMQLNGYTTTDNHTFAFYLLAGLFPAPNVYED